MGSAPFVEVDVVPICHLKTMKGVPEKESFVRFIVAISLSVIEVTFRSINGSLAAIIGLVRLPARPEIGDSGVDCQHYVAFVIDAVGAASFDAVDRCAGGPGAQSSLSLPLIGLMSFP